MKLRFAVYAICLVLAVAGKSRAEVVLAVDVGSSTSPTQAGFMPWYATGATYPPANSITDPTSGVSVTLTDIHGGQGFRDRGALPVLSGSSISDLLRDFIHASVGTDVSMTLKVGGLQPNTDYQVTLYGFDPKDNDGRGTSWYLGTNNSGQHIVSFFNDNSSPPLPLGPAFSQVFNTGAGTTLSFFGQGDVSASGFPLTTGNNATVVVFNGLVVETAAVPEPTSLALCTLTALAGFGAAWRRRK